MRLLITVLGAGIGAGVAALTLPWLVRQFPALQQPLTPGLAYVGLCLIGGLISFFLSPVIIARIMHLMSATEKRWSAMPARQIVLTAMGLVIGLMVAALTTQLVLSAGATLLTITFSAMIYVLLGTLGTQIGYRRYNEGRFSLRKSRKKARSENASAFEALLDDPSDEEDAEEDEPPMRAAQPKLLDTSVIIDGRILDIAKTGFLEGDIVVAQFVLAELRHIADSGDGLRRARGRRGLDVLQKLQKELKTPIVVDETDFDDVSEVDVKLLRLCRERGGVVVTNDYNLNKVAGVTGIPVLNINDLANAVKPMLLAGEELTVQVVREGKEPGQGVAYLDDGTMIVVDNGRRYLGERVQVVVTTVLQTSAGRMIFTRLKSMEEKAG